MGIFDQKTIYAVSTATGKAGIAVIRLSGDDIEKVLADLLPGQPLPYPRKARYCQIINPKKNEVLDDVLLLYFPAPTSYTGENILEIHCHGSLAVISAILSVLAEMPFLRVAEAGEFTRRAVLNGKMDLTSAEGLLDLINAETEMQRKVALRQAKGALCRVFSGWAYHLERMLAHLEAVIDFAEENLPSSIEESVDRRIITLSEEIEHYLERPKITENLHSGLMVTILGPPNSGKSTFLNHLAGDERALVSDQPGTTRDMIEVRLNLAGIPILLTDTAGLRSIGAEDLEKRGIEKALKRAEQSDLIIAFYDATCSKARPLIENADFIVENKIDRISEKEKQTLSEKYKNSPIPGFLLSLHNGENIDVFLQALQTHIEKLFSHSNNNAPLLTRARYREALFHVKHCLENAQKTSEIELKAEDLRQALYGLGKITGKYDIESLLDIVFNDFCLGK